MATITTRSGKGSPLTNNEVDSNFTNLNTDKVEKSGDTLTGNLNFGDNNKIQLGAGNDLQIYSDGASGVIQQVGAGVLLLKGQDFYVQNDAGSNYIRAAGSAQVDLYYGGVKKFETTSSGIDVTGTVTADGLTVDGTLGNWSIDSQGAIQDFGYAGTNYIRATNAAGALRFGSGGQNNRLNIASTGDISFYEDTGTTPKFFWDASAERLGLGTSSPDGELDVRGGLVTDIIARSEQANGIARFIAQNDARSYSVKIHSDDKFVIKDETADTNRLTIDTSGNVGIGASSAARPLIVNGLIGSRNSTTGFGASDGFDIGVGGSDAYIVQRGNANIIIETNGAERMRIDSSGNVGIGNSNPTQKLQVDNGDITIRSSSYADTRSYGFGNPARQNDAAFIKYVGKGNFTGDLHLGVVTSAANVPATEILTIHNSGNVGIGTSSPSQELHVYSASATADVRLQGSGGTNYMDVFQRDTAMGLYGTGGIPMLFSTAGAERMRIGATGNVGIGTTSPTRQLHVKDTSSQTVAVFDGGANSAGEIGFRSSGTSGDTYVTIGAVGNDMVMSAGADERMRIDYVGRVGIGVSSPARLLHVETNTNGSTGALIKNANSGSNAFANLIVRNDSNNVAELGVQSSTRTTTYSANEGWLYVSTGLNLGYNGNTKLFAGSSERMRIASNGRVGIGTTNPLSNLAVVGSTAGSIQAEVHNGLNDNAAKSVLKLGSLGGSWFIENRRNGGKLAFTTGSTDYMVMDNNNVGIGTDDPAALLDLQQDQQAITTANLDNNTAVGLSITHPSGPSAVANEGIALALGARNRARSYIASHYTGTSKDASTTAFYNETGGVIYERMRITHGGHVLVGKTSNTYNTAGTSLQADGRSFFTADGSYAGAFNRKTSDGDIVVFSKNGNTVGSIGTSNNDIYIGTGDTSLTFVDGSDTINPTGTSGAQRSDTVSLGDSNNRFKDLYLSNDVRMADNGAIYDQSRGYSRFTFSSHNYYTTTATLGEHRFSQSDGSESMRVDASGNLLVGTTSGSGASAPDNSSTASDAGIRLSGSGYIGIGNNSNPSLYLNIIGADGDIARFNKDGTTVGSIGVQNSGSDLVIDATRYTNRAGLRFRDSALFPRKNSADADAAVDLGGSSSRFKDLYLSGTAYVGTVTPSSALADVLIKSKGDGGLVILDTEHTNSSIRFRNAGSEVGRFDSSGNLLVGTTLTPTSIATATLNANQGIGLSDSGFLAAANEASAVMALNRLGTDGDIAQFRKQGALVGSIGVISSDNMYVTSTVSGQSGVGFVTGAITPYDSGTETDNATSLGNATYRFKDLYLSGTARGANLDFTGTVEADSTLLTRNKLQINNGRLFEFLGASTHLAIKDSSAGTERMRLDSSGNLLVGKASAAGASTLGIEVRPNGDLISTRSGNAALTLNRKTSDGTIAQFRKDNTTVGSIGSVGGSALFINSIGTGKLKANGSDRYAWDASQFYPTDDNLRDLGFSTFRWDDVYATNGTINTSDRNEKQDIEALSDAEQRVAVACKGLLRKFRWRSSVADKGDEARIHFGIIAQDLQAAFEAEGLDAERYAMFISTTWTDEETGEERSRMGVRYSELLAFIIAAI